jgi:hypothetical protein
MKVKEIQNVEINPGPHDKYNGAGNLPVVSRRIADLLQTKPVASCWYGDAGDVYWVSYDKSFPAQELRGLCEGPISGEGIEKRFKGKDIIQLYYAND